MSYFGKISALDSRSYTFDVSPNTLPLELFVHVPEGSDRDFVLLPEQSQIEKFSRKCSMYFSQGLDAKFQYAGGGLSTVVVGTEQERTSVGDKLDFVIARWARNGEAPFPDQIRLTVKDLSLDPKLNFIEIISASAKKISEGK
ncbi:MULTISPECIES: hypothetical protein [unclassified Arthrobacter]|uniref:hypothetical protein n=1 Tax=unclassified Arthrobacter TaxID=235627 RepID=UPI0011AFF9CF|nr:MULTISPECIES: hypothetical protein [unclassified Arthrobacter]